MLESLCVSVLRSGGVMPLHALWKRVGNVPAYLQGAGSTKKEAFAEFIVHRSHLFLMTPAKAGKRVGAIAGKPGLDGLAGASRGSCICIPALFE